MNLAHSKTQLFLFLFVVVLALPVTSASAQSGGIPWSAWGALEISTIGDDNTGSSVAMSSDVTTPDGNPAMMVTPSGTSEETKLAIPFPGAALVDFLNYSQAELEVFLPEANAVNANKFFMGMADLTGGEFNWVEGVFSETTAQPGWNRIVYVLDPAMRLLLADHDYTIFLSFFNADDAGTKTPLTEPFYLGGGYLNGEDPIEAPAPAEAEAAPPAESGPTEALWQVWEAYNPGMFGDDNTGTEFAQSSEITSPAGAPTLQIIPSGLSEETKLAYPVSGNNLQAWLEYGQIQLDVYLPAENTLNPNMFFLGLAEITGDWTWVGGLFGIPTGDSGWIRVVVTFDPVIREINPNGAYMMYIASFNQDGNGNKTPLTEPFYLGQIHLVPMPEAETNTAAPVDTTADDRYRQEVEILLRMDDDVFIDAVARETFDFFWFEANPANGLIKDRSTPDSVSSIAAVGFGLAAIPVGVDRGWISYDEGYERALITLQTFTSGGVQGEHGFFYHFVNMETGERAWNSEVSSIDTALLVAGALVAGQYFEGTEVQTLADQLYANVEWDWMLGGGELLKMGWKPDSAFINASWDHFDESLILYVLAIGSPTHPIPATSWDLWDRPVNVNGGYIYLPGEPLFVYQYPLAFLNLQGMEDYYANYWNNTALACERNRQFAIDNSGEYATYENGVWGISASDGPFGYRAYGAAEINHDGTVALYASAACLPFTPEIALEGMRAVLTEYGVQAWREYGLVSAINEDENWFSREHIGIDQGDVLLMIANSQDGFVWNLFGANPNIQNALAAMGFVESSGDYAVTPAYLAEVSG